MTVQRDWAVGPRLTGGSGSPATWAWISAKRVEFDTMMAGCHPSSGAAGRPEPTIVPDFEPLEGAESVTFLPHARGAA